MMVGEQIYEGSSLTQVIEGVLGKLEPKGTIVAPAEADEGVTQEGTKEVLESLVEEGLADGGRKEDVNG